MLMLDLNGSGFWQAKLGVSLGFKWKYRPFEGKVIAPEWFIEAISSPFM